MMILPVVYSKALDDVRLLSAYYLLSMIMIIVKGNSYLYREEIGQYLSSAFSKEYKKERFYSVLL